MSCFDIRPFALPNTAANEIRFEDPRDVVRVAVTYADTARDSVTLSYLRKTWPHSRPETLDPAAHSHGTGWIGIDDWFNPKWQEAAVNIERIDGRTLSITFKGLHTELSEVKDYDVTFRRTLGVKIDSSDGRLPEKVEVCTTSQPAVSELRVSFGADKAATGEIKVSGYNAAVKMGPETSKDGARTFGLKVEHMTPAHPFSYDEGLVTFDLGDDAFTISLDSLAKQGPIWFDDQGAFVTFAHDPTTLDQYIARNAATKTTSKKVTDRAEQSYSGAMNGLPRPHPCACTVGCKHARQRFWLEPNGDILTMGSNLRWIKGRDTDRCKIDTDARFMFGLGNWRLAGRYFDPAPSMVYNTRLMRDDIVLEQKTLATPLEKSIFDDLAGDDTIICLSRFTFTNTGDGPAVAELPISYSADCGRSHNRLEARDTQSDQMVPHFKPEKLDVSDLHVTDASGAALLGVQGEWKGQSVLRCAIASQMEASQHGDGIMLRKKLAPGESCEVVLKVPHIDLDQPAEIAALASLDYEKSLADVRRFWRNECAIGAQLDTGEPNLDALYKSHVAHVELTDSRMCDDPDLINTSVGTSTYGNYTNESCMIVEELDERGLHDQARRRIAVWLKYQGTVGLKGLFTDHDGVFYGAGGYEMGQSYDQHHGWVLWYIAKHFFFTGDAQWLQSIANQLVRGVDWVARQRNETQKDMAHSRGWETGFLAAGGLEDVDDYFYWLSTNALTWRGVEWAARALEAIGHPEAARVRMEADDYKQALIRGFETMRRQSPLVRLKDGRWIPHYPSRLYRRGRDIGWIREVLEGSVYLLISGLYDSNSKQGQWILDDYLDNRYMHPYYSYPVFMPERSWIDYGGFSNQPNLLAGLMPHLERDEPEIYIWMFFNAWASCYREEVNAMVEHPQPILGFSNSAIYKTSDQANAIKWLRYMYVYATDSLLHLGRAIPRQWLRDGNEPYAEDVATRFGKVGVRYVSEVGSGRIKATIDLENRSKPAKTLVRFRHPEKLPVKSVTVNGAAHDRFDAEKGDVDISGLRGRVDVVATY
jgi:hypothetical protein